MFEHSLIDLESKQQPRRRRWLFLPIAVGLHLVALAAFALAGYWSVGSVPEPDLNVVFFALAPPPPPPAGGGGGHTKPPKPATPEVKPPAPTPTVQPSEHTIPDAVSPATHEEEVVADPDSRFAGDDPGLPPGPGHGRNVGPGRGEVPGGPEVSDVGVVDNEPIHIRVGVTRPEVIHRVQPKYTEAARRVGVQGTVIVEAVIDEQGYVTRVRVLRGLPMGLDQQAVEAIQQWRFTPASMAGQPVKVFFVLTANFTIQR